MIVRVLTARVRSERAAALNSKLRQQLPILREQPGLVYVKLARRLGPNDEALDVDCDPDSGIATGSI